MDTRTYVTDISTYYEIILNKTHPFIMVNIFNNNIEKIPLGI